MKEFVAERDPERIAVNFIARAGPLGNGYRGEIDGLSHTDYVLLTEELGEKYASRLISSEWVMMDYVTRRVPSEIELLKRMRQDELGRVEDSCGQDSSPESPRLEDCWTSRCFVG